MDPKDREQKLDAWLDDALAHYNDAEPRAGLAQRILATVRAEERTPRRRWWVRWGPAMAAVAAIAIVAIAVRPMWRGAQPDTHKPHASLQQEPRRDEKVEATAGTSHKALRSYEMAADKSRTRVEKPGAAEVATASKGTAKANSARRTDEIPPSQTLMARNSNMPVERAEPARSQSLGRDADIVTLQVPVQQEVPIAAAGGVASQVVARSVPLPRRNSVTSPMMAAKGLPVPMPTTSITPEERLMLQAAMNGGLQPAREQMPPKDELLPMVKIPEIEIENISEK
jgi:hypothetical protein